MGWYWTATFTPAVEGGHASTAYNHRRQRIQRRVHVASFYVSFGFAYFLPAAPRIMYPRWLLFSFYSCWPSSNRLFSIKGVSVTAEGGIQFHVETPHQSKTLHELTQRIQSRFGWFCHSAYRCNLL